MLAATLMLLRLNEHPWLSCSQFFPDIVHVHSGTEMHFVHISHLRSLRNTNQAFAFTTETNKAKQTSSKASCALWVGGDLDTLHTHQGSFQILTLSTRKVLGKYVFSIFHFNGFPRVIYTLSLFYIEPNFIWLILFTPCC